MTTTRSASRTRGTSVSRAAVNGHTYAHTSPGSRQVPLRSHTAEALSAYFANLNGHRPGRLYELVLREVEEPLFRAVMSYAEGNQCKAAAILGINRGTLRKKLREYGLAD